MHAHVHFLFNRPIYLELSCVLTVERLGISVAGLLRTLSNGVKALNSNYCGIEEDILMWMCLLEAIANDVANVSQLFYMYYGLLNVGSVHGVGDFIFRSV